MLFKQYDVVLVPGCYYGVVAFVHPAGHVGVYIDNVLKKRGKGGGEIRIIKQYEVLFRILHGLDDGGNNPGRSIELRLDQRNVPLPRQDRSLLSFTTTTTQP